MEFDAESVVTPILSGWAHTDAMSVPAPSDGGEPFDGFTLRLFDPTDETWRIWWSSTRAPGVLDVPMAGRFEGGHGLFHATDTIGGHDVHVRFTWVPDGPEGPRWQQHFSYDAGATWRLTWTMTFARA